MGDIAMANAVPDELLGRWGDQHGESLLVKTVPLVLGLVAGAAVATLAMVGAITSGASLLTIPIILGVGLVGTGIGIYVGWLFRKNVIKR